MDPAAPLNSVAAGDVLATIFQTQNGDPQTLAPTPITFELTPFAGQTVRLRFALANTLFFFRAAVDDVQIESTPINQPPTCNGLLATVYVKDGVIVGGPDNGKPYIGSLIGTSGNDVMVGTEGRDAINGRVGNDTICALGGDDRIEGAGGNDTLYGGLGADRFKGGAGADSAPDFNAGEGDSQEQVEQLS
jgi:Ca2+-binding RTX toxin-like protein